MNRSIDTAARPGAQSAERELLATICAGSCSAMEELYFLYFARLGNFFLHVTGNTDLVEELISDTLFDVWRESARIDSDISVPAWIMGLAYLHAQACPAGTQFGALASQKPLGLQDLLMKLPFEERAVIHLAYAGDHSRQGIAEIMKISGERVDDLFTQARDRLRYLIENERQHLPSQESEPP